MTNIKLDFNDLLIVPKTITDINSRSEVDPFAINGYLPILTAPMDTVVSEYNHHIFDENKIGVCLPRHIEFTKRLSGFKSYSIGEIQILIANNCILSDYYLIDVANGHMDSVLKITKEFKRVNSKAILMVGNVANPETYAYLSDAGADYIRVGIGNGGGCLTTQQTGVGYPMASLIKECYEISTTLRNPAHIVADGGMQTYSDIIKALALGADYVMLGSILNKCLESCGETYRFSDATQQYMLIDESYTDSETLKNLMFSGNLYKKFRGMSTKEVQKKWGIEQLKTSEGVIKFNRVEYTLKQWCENFESYLRSAMSYTGAHNLNEFIGKVDLVQISDNAYKRFNK